MSALHGTLYSFTELNLAPAGGPGGCSELESRLPAQASHAQKRESSYKHSSAHDSIGQAHHMSKSARSAPNDTGSRCAQMCYVRPSQLIAAHAVLLRAGTGGAGGLLQRRGSGGGKEGGRAERGAAARGELVNGVDQLA